MVEPVTATLALVGTAASLMGGMKAKNAAKQQARLAKQSAVRSNKFKLKEMGLQQDQLRQDFPEVLRDINEGFGERFEGDGSHSSQEDYARQKAQADQDRRISAIQRQKDFTMANMTDADAVYRIQQDLQSTLAMTNMIQNMISGGAMGVAKGFGV